MRPQQEFPQRPTRLLAHEHCIVARENGEVAGGLLLNLSDGGFCIESRLRVDVGERVELRIMGLGRVSGIIRWTDSNRADAVLEPLGSGEFE